MCFAYKKTRCSHKHVGVLSWVQQDKHDLFFGLSSKKKRHKFNMTSACDDRNWYVIFFFLFVCVNLFSYKKSRCLKYSINDQHEKQYKTSVVRRIFYYITFFFVSDVAIISIEKKKKKENGFELWESVDSFDI